MFDSNKIKKDEGRNDNNIEPLQVLFWAAVILCVSWLNTPEKNKLDTFNSNCLSPAISALQLKDCINLSRHIEKGEDKMLESFRFEFEKVLKAEDCITPQTNGLSDKP